MSAKEIKEHLDRIRSLENQLIKLKRELVQSKSLASIHQKEKDHLTFVILQVEDRFIAVPVQFVVEMVQMVELIPSSKVIEGVAGLVNYHGDILAVINVGELLGLPKSTIDPDKSMAICHLEPFRFALLVDDTLDLVTVSPEQVKVEEEVLPGSLRAVGIVQAVGHTSVIIDLWSIVVSVQKEISREIDGDILRSIPADKSIEPSGRS